MRPTWTKAQNRVMDLTGLSVNVTSGPASPIPASLLALLLDGTDLDLEMTGTAQADFNSFSATNPVFATLATSAGNFQQSYTNATQVYNLVVNGTTVTSIANAANVLPFQALDIITLRAWYKPSIGAQGLFFGVNGNYKSSNKKNSSCNNFNNQLWTVNTNFPAGAVVSDLSSLVNSDRFSFLTVAGGLSAPAIEPTWNGSAGARQPGLPTARVLQPVPPALVDNAVTWRMFYETVPVGSAAMGTPTGFTFGQAPIIWTGVRAYKSGYSFIAPCGGALGATSTGIILRVGDSITSCNAARISAGGQIFGPSGFAGRPTVIDYAHSGDFIADQSNGWSLGRYLQDNGSMQAVILRVGVNDILANHSTATVTAALQALVNLIQATYAGPLILYPITPCHAALTAAQYTIWQAVNANIQGGGGTPITGTAALHIGTQPPIGDVSNNLLPAYNSGDNLHPNNAGAVVIGATERADLVTFGALSF